MNQTLEPSIGKRRLTPVRIALLYAVFSALWIFVSSALLTISVDDPVLQGRIEFGKGLLYVLVSSSLLYLVLKQWCDPLPPMAPTQAGSAGDSRTGRPAKLYRRVLALVALLALVPLAGLVVVKVHRPQIEREALANLEAIAELKASQIENWFGERYNDGMIIMSAPGFIRQVSELQRDGSAKNREAVLAGLIAVVDAVQYESALLLDPSGRTLITLGEHSHVQPQTAALLSHAQELGRPVSTESFIAPAGDRLHCPTVPVCGRAATVGRLSCPACLSRDLPLSVSSALADSQCQWREPAGSARRRVRTLR